MEKDIQVKIDTLKKEKENFLYLAEGLSYDHQTETRQALLRKTESIQESIDELEQLLNKNK
ncbi:MAG: hypothetical protein WC428_02300 [Candidatus Paceibacterota bacterium]|jgi:hypothetical protein